MAPGGLDAGGQSEAEGQLDCASDLWDLERSGLEGGGGRGKECSRNAACRSSPKSSRAHMLPAQRMIAAVHMPGSRAALQPAASGG